MFSFLKCHPFPVVAHFDRVLALSFAFPEDVLTSLVPPPLVIDRYEGLGFVTVALVWTRHLRPAGWPKALGNDFFLAGFRVFVRGQDGKRRLRGLRILRSETDQRRMVFFGNLFTRYHYERVRVEDTPGRLVTKTSTGGTSLDITYEVSGESDLPAGSPFPDWKTARRFAGPMPFTFEVGPGGRVLAIEGRRAQWTPKPVRIDDFQVALFEHSPFAGTPPVLANAFAVEAISYRWERGRFLNPPCHA